MENVTPIMAANRDAMLRHFEMLFGRAMAGRIEVTAIKAAPKDERVAPRTHFFSLDQFEEAAEWAASINAEPGWNLYVGAALRQEDVFPGKAADDTDFLETWAVWADCDDEEQVTTARARYQEADTRPPFIVVTGRTPERRAQLWWPLEEPIRDIEILRATVRGIADALGTDHGVLTGKQLMRLAGSVSWPKPHKPGRILEPTELITPATADYEFSLHRLQRAFPITERQAPAPKAEPVGTLAGAMAYADLRSALASMRSDDRELWVRMGHALKELGDQGRGLWLEWSQTSPKYEPEDAARVWDSLRGERTGYQAVFAEAQRGGWVNPASRPPEPTVREIINPQTGEVTEVTVGAPDDLFEVLSIADLRTLPEMPWLYKDALPAGALGFIYGPPASFKSFVCYDLGLRLAYGVPDWLGHEARGAGSVLYIASEGITGAKNRIIAWQQACGIAEDTDRFHLIRKTINFLHADDVGRLDRTVKAHIDQHGPCALIFVDTVSRVLPGADENLQKDMTLFVAACDRLREHGATVVGVHHTNKNGDMRGSTVFLGQGDFIYRVERNEGERSGVITCEKQKEAEDGWKRAYTVAEQTWLPPGRIEPVTSLTIEYGGEPQPEDTEDRWPSRETCRAMQKSLDEAWRAGKPWSPYVQTRREGRYAITNLSSDHGVPAGVVQMMIEQWQKNQMIGLEEVDKHSKMKGLKVLQWVD